MKKIIILALLPLLISSCFNPKQIKILSSEKPSLSNVSIGGANASMTILIENRSLKDITLEDAVIKVKDINSNRNIAIVKLLSDVNIRRKTTNDVNVEFKVNYSTAALLEFVTKGGKNADLVNNIVIDADITAIIGNSRKSFSFKNQNPSKIMNSELYNSLFNL